eukprot:TRINITY_DN7183_c0_g2_i1.p1 TRINITY_DN7183_c0_g2~~TRINITY_DN7183_c0_g2_i1.p1  ORF type:complete len:557 (+),score=214.01 TRINITY_DN7183_c0_g2_i1:46-1671(+)
MIRFGAGGPDETLQNNVDRLQASVDAAVAERDALNRDFNAYKAAAADVAAPLHKELKAVVEELALLRPEAERLREAAKKVPEVDPELEAKFNALETESSSLKEEMERLQKERTIAVEGNADLKRELYRERTSRIEIVRDAHAAYEKARAATVAEIEGLKKELADADNRYWPKVTNISELTARAANADREIAAAQKKIDTEVEKRTEALETSNADLTRRNTALVEKVAELTEKTVQLSQRGPPPAAPTGPAAMPPVPAGPAPIPGPAGDQRALIESLQREKAEHLKKIFELEQGKRDLKAENDRMRVLLRTSGQIPSGQEIQVQQKAIAESRKKGTGVPVVAGPAATVTKMVVKEGPGEPGELCEYLTNEAGWREGKVLAHMPEEKSYKIEDTQKGWVLEKWPEEHVKVKRTPQPQAVAEVKNNDFTEGQKADAMYDGKWFECIIKAVSKEAKTCDVTWTQDQSFTPGLPMDQIKHKPSVAAMPVVVPAAGGVIKKPGPYATGKKGGKGKGKGKGGKSVFGAAPAPYPGASSYGQYQQYGQW